MPDDRSGTEPTEPKVPSRWRGYRPPGPYLAGAVVVAVVLLGGGVLVGLPPWAFLLLGVLTIGVPLLLWQRRQRRGKAGGVATAALHFVGVGVASMVLIQAVPYGRTHADGPVVGEPAWADARTRELMVNACFACHSNQTAWPWYAQVAPISWAVTSHVEEGRSKVNFSTFTIDPGAADETLDVILNGSMPPGYYTRFGRHPEARLTTAELTELVAGIRATPGLSDGRGGDDGGDRKGGDRD